MSPKHPWKQKRTDSHNSHADAGDERRFGEDHIAGLDPRDLAFDELTEVSKEEIQEIVEGRNGRCD